MVVKKVDGDGTQNTQVIADGVTIQRIKEIVGNHSDADIYATLEETNNDPSETIQKLLYQDPFHEVRRKRDKKKEPAGYNIPAETRKIPEKVSPELRKIPENVSPEMRKIPENISPKMRKIPENVSRGTNSNTFSDRKNRRGGGFIRNSFTGRSREFRIVRDNRINQAANKEIMPPLQQDAHSAGERSTSGIADSSISTGTAQNQQSGGGRHSFNVENGPVDSHFRHHGSSASATDAKVLLDESRSIMQNTYSRSQTGKPNSRPSSAGRNSSNSVLGVYSSSSDPVHVPSSLRPSAAVGTFRRDVGVVGGRRQSSDNSGKYHPMNSSHTSSVKDNNAPAESLQQFSTFSRSHQLGQNSLPDSVPGTVTKSFMSNHHGYRSHQQPVGHHHKGTQPVKEWKPKSSQKSGSLNPGVIGAFAKPVSLSTENSEENSQNVKVEDTNLEEEHSPTNSDENQSVLIAEHIRVAEAERCRLTFGSFGIEANSNSSNSHATVDSGVAAPSSLLVPAMESSGDGTGHNSPESSTLDIASDHQLSEKEPSSSPQDLENYGDIIRVNNNSSSDTPSVSQQQDPSELANFSAYDLQTGYDIPYFRPSIEESVRGQGLPSSQEVLISPPANIPTSSMTMLQQQQQPVAQMYPQVHVSHYANLMPYRQFLSPVYVPPMAMPGYSSNPGYSHPSNANSFVLMPGGGSHLNMNGLKYGVQQFKPVPNGSPTGFGNFASPTGYTMNGPGVVGGATGLDESSRLKYKDGNLYVPNPQAESSEMWIQNPRELQGLQSPPFYNMPGQAPHAAAYMPSHTGHHANYNAAAAAAAQSSHMQFPGLYHPSPQPTALGNPHHMAPTIGGNVGVGVAPAAPGAQVGAYQQPQLGHLNWTTNF